MLQTEQFQSKDAEMIKIRGLSVLRVVQRRGGRASPPPSRKTSRLCAEPSPSLLSLSFSNPASRGIGKGDTRGQGRSNEITISTGVRCRCCHIVSGENPGADKTSEWMRHWSFDTRYDGYGTRAIALGRKNWLFVGSEQGGHHHDSDADHQRRPTPPRSVRLPPRPATSPTMTANDDLAMLLPNRWPHACPRHPTRSAGHSQSIRQG